MNKIKQLNKVKELLKQANFLLSQIPSNNFQETNRLIKKTIQSVDDDCKHCVSKKNSKNEQFRDWWGNVESGSKNLSLANLSQNTQKSLLSKINNLINNEQIKIEDIKNQSNYNDQNFIQE
jgi:hypothetical protein